MAERQAGLLYTPKGVFVSVELRMLTFSVVLGILQIIAASHAASLQRSYRWTASPRDEKVEPLRGVAGRLNRALHEIGLGTSVNNESTSPTLRVDVAGAIIVHSLTSFLEERERRRSPQSRLLSRSLFRRSRTYTPPAPDPPSPCIF